MGWPMGWRLWKKIGGKGNLGNGCVDYPLAMTLSMKMFGPVSMSPRD